MGNYERKPTPEKYCEVCGVKLERNVYGGRLEDLGRFMRRKFCSLHCANQRKQVGKAEYHRRARKFRKANCEACGQATSLQVHHQDHDHTNNDPANLQTLCAYCHTFWHAVCVRRKRIPPGPMPKLF